MKYLTPILLLVLTGPTLAQSTRPAVVSVRLDELNQLKAEVERLRDEVGRLRKENAKLREATAPTPKEAQRDAKIRQAIKDGTLCVGMTLEEAERACKANSAYSGYTLERETEDAKLYEFAFAATLGPRTAWRAWMRDGKIVEWSK